MILLMKKNASIDDVEKLEWMGFEARASGEEGNYTIALIKGVDALTDTEQFKKLPLVEDVSEFKHPFKLAAREFHPKKTVIKVKNIQSEEGF
jgi:3-deoxy-7-phosphoheptulonate synthase